MIIQRVNELTENTRNLRNAQGLENLYKEFDKNLYKYLYTLSMLQTIYPLVLREVLVPYLKLIEFIIDNPESFSEYTLRAAVICLSAALRRYAYQEEDIMVRKRPSADKFEEIKKQCAAEMYQFFTQEKVQSFFNIFLLKLLPIRAFLTENQDLSKLDDFIEIGNYYFFVIKSNVLMNRK